jgi:hypothetical protein
MCTPRSAPSERCAQLTALAIASLFAVSLLSCEDDDYIRHPEFSEPSHDARLSGIRLSAGDLGRAFDAEVLDYNASVNFLSPAVRLSAFTEDENATLTILGLSVDSGVPTLRIPLAEGENRIPIHVRAEDGKTTRTYTLSIHRRSAAEVAQSDYIQEADTLKGDFFGGRSWGNSVAFHGDTLVVGAPWEDGDATGVNNESAGTVTDSGAVFVYQRRGESWIREAYIKAPDPAEEDYFGYSVAIHGDVLAIRGAHQEYPTQEDKNVDRRPGAVYLFERVDGKWQQCAILYASNTTERDSFGNTLALYGDTLAVGAIGESRTVAGVDNKSRKFVFTGGVARDSGAVYIFERSNGEWTETTYLKAPNPGLQDFFGWSLALTGDTLAVGARYERSARSGINAPGPEDDNAERAGAVYVYIRTENGWRHQAYVKASNSGEGDWFGTSVSLSGDTLAVGALGESSARTGVNPTQPDNGDTPRSGAVYVFRRVDDAWSEEAIIKASNAAKSASFGKRVALSGDVLAVTSLGESTDAKFSGAAYLLSRERGVWTEQRMLKAPVPKEGDSFGSTLALHEGTLIVGDNRGDREPRGVDSEAPIDPGAIYVFQ